MCIPFPTGEHLLVGEGGGSYGFASGDLGTLSLLVVQVPLPQSTVHTLLPLFLSLTNTHTQAHTHTHTHCDNVHPWIP